MSATDSGMCTQHMETDTGKVQGLYSHAKVQHVPITSHYSDRASGGALEIQIRTWESAPGLLSTGIGGTLEI